MSRNLSCGWSADYLPKKLYMEEKKVCGCLMLSEAFRQQSAWQISLPVGLVCVRRYTNSFYMLLIFYFDGVSDGGLCQLETYQSELSGGQRNITRTYWHLFVYCKATVSFQKMELVPCPKIHTVPYTKYIWFLKIHPYQRYHYSIMLHSNKVAKLSKTHFVSKVTVWTVIIYLPQSYIIINAL